VTVDTPLTHADSIIIARSPADLYDMISDVTRMGEWSPVCKACWWDDGSGPAVGAWFTGRNELVGRDPWETRSQVVAASPGEEFAFMVGGTLARWGYTFTQVDGGTRVTESWEMRPAGIERFKERYGPDAAAQVRNRFEAARTGIPVTLAALKRVAEAGSLSILGYLWPAPARRRSTDAGRAGSGRASAVARVDGAMRRPAAVRATQP
jgi:Polyketide cyclase / dehydrase and lipid transport